MGAGNTQFRSYDLERYQPSTYFIDFGKIKTDENELEDLHQLAEDNYDDFRNSFFEDFDIPTSQHPRNNDLTSSFRQSVVVLASTSTGLIITESSSELYHFPITIVPSFTYDELFDEAEENEEEATKEYEKLLAKFHEENEPIMQSIFLMYKDAMSIRAGAWGCGSIPTNEEYKFL